MKTIMLLAVLSPWLLQAQTVPAPDAVTMRITKVVVVHKDEAGGDGNTVFTNTATNGFKLRAVAGAVRYDLSCIVSLVTTTLVVNGKLDNSLADADTNVVYQHGQGKLIPVPVCEHFHVGDQVTFYSLNNLIWLSHVEGTHRWTHSSNWPPELYEGRLVTFKNEYWQEKAYSIDSEEEVGQRHAPLKRK